ncbi:hypothetical protein Agau_C100495 [Agrobacterium tumefaciens F2]|jgi:GT2 family glycosyltransferase|nr:hypothetical protein Agau_C100495 [Agrobacterium tumefaciens F2]
MRRLAAVILTYNSDDDLTRCLAGLAKQQGVLLDIIVVDNRSEVARRERMFRTLRALFPSVHRIRSGSELPCEYRCGDGVFVSNDRNAGYSAGNNIGARIAVKLGCSAILIVNPDVRISEPYYLAKLSEALFGHGDNAVAASVIRNLSGGDENPMFEPDFWQELFWPVRMITSRLASKRGQRDQSQRVARRVEKLSGCCFLIRSAFLEAVGYFDQNVFLYCEEAILAAQVRQAGAMSIYVDNIEAVHAHRSSAKGDPVRRQQLWSRSRKYYHSRYLGYGRFRRAMLAVSHGLVIALTWTQSRFFGRAT